MDGEKGSIDFVGNRTECALLVMLKNWGEDYKLVRELNHDKIIEIFGFSSERKMASVLVRKSTGYRLYSKVTMLLLSYFANSIMLLKQDIVI